MTEASRKPRYAPVPRKVALTDEHAAILSHVGECGVLTISQAARILPLSYKASQRRMRALMDAGLLELVPMPVPPGEGSAPNAYVLTREGAKAAGGGAKAGTGRTWRYLEHELGIGEVRGWLAASARAGGHVVERFERTPVGPANPDCWFSYRTGRAVLVGLVEIDRGTERGPVRWDGKAELYRQLFAGDFLQGATGYKGAKVLVLCPGLERLARLGSALSQLEPDLRVRFLISMASITQLERVETRWYSPGAGFVSLFPPGTV